MFAVDHAATALLLRRRYPTVPMVALLLAVQAISSACSRGGHRSAARMPRSRRPERTRSSTGE